MAINFHPTTLTDFETFINLPENADKLFEYIAGEIIEVSSNPYSSQIASRINGFIFMYLMQNNIGRITGADGGYMIGDERYLPDVGFISNTRQPERPSAAYNPLPPDLAVEVISPTDDTARIRLKIANYTHAGTTVWLIDPEKQTVEIYAPDAPAVILDHTGTLSGGSVLPGFSLSVKDIFPTQE